ncbi:hypothetical protein LMJ53_16675 [Rheinheimera sp. UJ51]|uniref:hypothetical protein n=1 Tax=Rheinheimera sp. UJ51 TaxID=2892446 RepID=UPI001E47DAED|nr:hypothetical protein [Rheinheimera sp. UJ51]MCC5453352.1 hypothetical protein [Rheinheimera sp. UJ51]
MTDVTQTLINNMELAQVIINQEFNVNDEGLGYEQLDLFPESIHKVRIKKVAARLLNITDDANFVAGVVAMLNNVYLPQRIYNDE